MPTMRCLAALLLALLFAVTALAQPAGYPDRAAALAALASPDADRRAEAAEWIAEHGSAADTEALRRRLTDDSPYVRHVAEQGLWRLWSHSGDETVDALLAKGVEEMNAGRFDAAIATFSAVIRRKPDFAEGWNKRATALFLAGEFRKSLADCDEVIKRNPHHFGALAGYGQIYFHLEQYAKAIEYWKRALEENPNLAGVEAAIEAAEQRIEEKRQHSI